MTRTFLLAMLVGFVSASQANAYLITYPQWGALDLIGRAGYVAGVVDLYLAFKQLNFGPCLSKMKITPLQLAVNVDAFVKAQPKLDTLPVPDIIIQYLVQACGAPTP